MMPFGDHLILVGQCLCGGGVEDNDKEEQVVLRWTCTCRGTSTNLALIITLI